ncbi:hypothetical protein MTR_1g090580 [Medicago truncatula]|uniref:Uncharacterized protein n=1 Tax=Medicago truncatula TaxID=3880 RepID=G7I410_MEDTR|nr:hypothetical protein MTR_1g090580 [Medicago truncatula]
MDTPKFVCYTDSILCINLIIGLAKNHHIYATFIQDIKGHVIHQQYFNLSHMREG